MTHWVQNCPVPLTNLGNSSATWRTIEAGIRTSGSWMHAFHYFLSSPSFTDEAVITMMKSFMEHARHLMTWPTGGNWLTMESNGLFHIGVMFPEFKEADGWRKTAVERMYAELDNQIYHRSRIITIKMLTYDLKYGIIGGKPKIENPGQKTHRITPQFWRSY